jgi:hypothetical protein
MAAGAYSFTIEQGATFDRTVTWRDSTGTLVNLTGYTAALVVKDTTGTTVVTPTLTLGGAAGTIRVRLTATQTAALEATSGRPHSYDLLMTAADGTTKTRLLQGSVGVAVAVSS